MSDLGLFLLTSTEVEVLHFGPWILMGCASLSPAPRAAPDGYWPTPSLSAARKSSSLPVRSIVASGTVNAIFRIGDHLAARFPLEPRDVEATRRWLESEADAARELVGRVRFPTPAPVALGEPGVGYPLPWSVQTWLPGVVATHDDPGRSAAFAHDLAAFEPRT